MLKVRKAYRYRARNGREVALEQVKLDHCKLPVFKDQLNSDNPYWYDASKYGSRVYGNEGSSPWDLLEELGEVPNAG